MRRNAYAYYGLLSPLLAPEIYCVIENDGGKKKEGLMKNFLLLLLLRERGHAGDMHPSLA